MPKDTPSLTPSLRFPAFQHKGAWEHKFLSQLFDNRQDTNLSHLPLLSVTKNEGIIPQEKSGRRDTSTIDKSKYLRVCPGDIAYNTMRMWEGRSAFVNAEGVVSPAYTICKPKKQSNGLFFSYYFKTHKLVGEFKKYSQGLVKDTLSLKFLAFSRISILTPSFPEQQKIADCLSSVDGVIEAQEHKLEALREHKKGLMQKLFPDDKKTTPSLRFPAFST